MASDQPVEWDEWDERDRGAENPLCEARRRVARVGNALMVAAVIGGLSNIGVLLVSHVVKKMQPKPEPPANMTPEQKKDWERGRAAAPLYEFLCISVVTFPVYVPAFFGGMKLRKG